MEIRLIRLMAEIDLEHYIHLGVQIQLLDIMDLIFKVHLLDL